MSSRSERLLREGLYLEAVQSYLQHGPLRSEADYGQFVHLLRTCLDHVPEKSPALFSKLLEIVFPIFQGDETVMLMLGQKCLDEEMYRETAFFLRKILRDINSDCLIARESLRAMYEVVVPRWHFLMLNDVIRNSSYSHATVSAVGRIPDCSVLDIGSGTGLLSMLAVRGGAARVYACEMNATMVTMSHDILAVNGMADKVTMIHKMSTDMTTPTDLPERVSLVVMETVDAGLLGEAIIPTLRHAWSHLLLPKQLPGCTNEIGRCGHVIPCGATVYVMAIECQEIARESRLLSEVVGGLSFHGITLEGSCKSDDSHMEQTEGAHRGKREGLTWRSRGEKGRVSRLGKEPYTCERLSHIRGGYKSLSDSCTALQFDFTDPQIPLPSAQLHVPVVTSGYLDAIVMYFDLHLDPTISISTSPHGNKTSSWDQAIFPALMGEKRAVVCVQKGDILHLNASCTDTLLHANIVRIERGEHYQEEMETCNNPTTEQPVIGLPIDFVDRGALRRLNDEAYFRVYSSAISHALEQLRAEDTESESGSSVESQDHTSEPYSSATCGTANSAGSGMESRHEETRLPSDEMLESENENEPETDEEDIANCIVLDMTHELSILGVMATKIGVDFVQVGRCYSAYEPLLEAVVRGNGLQEKTSIKWVELGVTSAPQLVWDMVLCDVVSPQGVLRTGVFEELGIIRAYQTHSHTVILPAKVTVHSVAISSPALRAQTTVLGSIPTLGLDIARFINTYQISHFIDADIGSLPHDTLTEETLLLSVDCHALSATLFTMENIVRMKVTGAGSVTGFLYWFTLHFPNGESISTGLRELGETHSHWHQAVFCLPEDLSVQSDQCLTVRALIKDSLLDISLVTVE